MSSNVYHSSAGFSRGQEFQEALTSKRSGKFSHFRGVERAAVGRGQQRGLPLPKGSQENLQKGRVNRISKSAASSLLKASNSVQRGEVFSRSPLASIPDPSNSPEGRCTRARECNASPSPRRGLFQEEENGWREVKGKRRSKGFSHFRKQERGAVGRGIQRTLPAERNVGALCGKKGKGNFLSESLEHSRSRAYSRDKKGTYVAEHGLQSKREEGDKQFFSLEKEIQLKTYLRANIKTISHIWDEIFAYASFYNQQGKLMKGDFPIGVPPAFPIPFRFSQRAVSPFIHVYSPTKGRDKEVSLEIFQTKYLAKGYDRRHPCDAVFFTDDDVTPTMVDNRRPLVSFRKAKLEKRVFTIWVRFHEEWEKVPDGDRTRLAKGRERLQVFWGKRKIQIKSLSELPIQLNLWNCILGERWHKLAEEGSWGELVQLRTTRPVEACNTYVWGLNSRNGLSKEQVKVFNFLKQFEQGKLLPGFFMLPQVKERG